MWTRLSFDMESFIEAVKLRSALYNKNHQFYTRKDVRAQLWDEICRVMFPEWEGFNSLEKNKKLLLLQRKWKSLKDCFNREIRYQKARNSKKNRKKYEFYDKLSFLLSNDNPESAKLAETKREVRIKKEKILGSSETDNITSNTSAPQSTPQSLSTLNQNCTTPSKLVQQSSQQSPSTLNQNCTTPNKLVQQSSQQSPSTLNQNCTTPNKLVQQSSQQSPSTSNQNCTTPNKLVQQSSQQLPSTSNQNCTTPSKLVQQSSQQSPSTLNQNCTTPNKLVQESSQQSPSTLNQNCTTPNKLVQQSSQQSAPTSNQNCTTPNKLVQQSSQQSPSTLNQNCTTSNKLVQQSSQQSAPTSNQNCTTSNTSIQQSPFTLNQRGMLKLGRNSRKRKMKNYEELLERPKQKKKYKEEEEDSDKLFFISFLSDFRRLPLATKYWVKIKFSEIMHLAAMSLSGYQDPEHGNPFVIYEQEVGNSAVENAVEGNPTDSSSSFEIYDINQ